MESKRFNILKFLLTLIFFSSTAICKAVVAEKYKPTEMKAILRVIEQDSRVELSSEKIKLVENQRVDQSLKMGSKLKKHIISVGMRKVNIDGTAGYIWVEVRLNDSSGRQIAYLVATVPSEKFSVGTSFKLNETKEPLVLTIDNM